MANQTVIETKGLTRHFGTVTAVDQLDLTITRGEIFGFLGHNGAGKTTTIRLLNGVLAPSTGVARVLGMDPVVDGPQLRRHTGVLTETPSLDDRLTGRENLRIYADLFGVPIAKVASRVDELLGIFELTERAAERVGGYSKGMRQRLALARALLHEPALIFLDEPTAGLDPVATRHVHQLITRLSREEGRTLFLCTHNLEEAQQLCDRVGVMEHGRLLASGTPAELIRQTYKLLSLDLEVAAADLPLALEQLGRYSTLQVEALNHEQIRVHGIAREAIPELIGMLSTVGVQIYRVNPREPSLADVYFALHEEANR